MALKALDQRLAGGTSSPTPPRAANGPSQSQPGVVADSPPKVSETKAAVVEEDAATSNDGSR